MSNILLEADGFTVDLRAVYGQVNQQEAPAVADNEIASELKAHGIPDDIVAKLLTLGDPFVKALKVLGFKKDDTKSDKNPILAFVKQEYVQNNLINTGLLSATTFKAIYNAVAKKLVADSEFFKANTYNIIYCRDLYSKSPAEMEKYLALQNHVLSASAVQYTPADQIFNKKVFILVDLNVTADKYAKAVMDSKVAAVDVTATSATLNSLDTAAKIMGKQTNEKTAKLSKANKTALVDSLKTTEDVFATMLMLSINAGSAKAKAAMTNKAFANMDSSKLAAASSKIAAALPKGAINTADADSLVDQLLAKVQQGI